MNQNDDFYLPYAIICSIYFTLFCSLSLEGPVGDALPFFSSMGFACPQRKDIPSFLLEVTTPAGQLNYASDELRCEDGLGLNTSGLIMSFLPLYVHVQSLLSDQFIVLQNVGEKVRFSPPQYVLARQYSNIILLRRAHGLPMSKDDDELRLMKRKSHLVSIVDMARHFWSKNPHGLAMKEVRDSIIQELLVFKFVDKRHKTNSNLTAKFTLHHPMSRTWPLQSIQPRATQMLSCTRASH